MPYLVGLTGGIGSGKSTVAEIFASLGAAVVDTDQIAHALTCPGAPLVDAIREQVGARFVHPDGSLDRQALRHHVFAHPAAKSTLEGLLHPAILREARLAAARQTTPYVLVVVPLLFESGQYRDWLQRVLVVDCPEELQIERTARRSNLPIQEIQAILRTQIPRRERLALADDIIVNDRRQEDLAPRIKSLHRRYLEMADGWNRRHL
jgi:dephospho-CoA kinase